VRSGASHLAPRALAVRLSNGRARRVGTGFGGEVRKNRRDVVALCELVGVEYFDTTILLDQVAVAINMRSK
jgi:hypothetical protein